MNREQDAGTTGAELSLLTEDIEQITETLPGNAQPRHYHKPTHAQNMLAAAFAGVVSAVFTAPFDTIRVRLAVQNNKSAAEAGRLYAGLIGGFSKTWAEEGIRGLYRGFGPTLLTVPLFWTSYFTAYSHFKAKIAEQRWLGDYSHGSLSHMVSAISAGAISDVLLNPLFVVRTRMQTQHMGQQQLKTSLETNTTSTHHNSKTSTAINASKPITLSNTASTTHSATCTSTSPTLKFTPLHTTTTPTAPNSIRPPVAAPYTNTLSALVKMTREEGISSWMRGISASLLGLGHVMVTEHNDMAVRRGCIFQLVCCHGAPPYHRCMNQFCCALLPCCL